MPQFLPEQQKPQGRRPIRAIGNAFRSAYLLTDDLLHASINRSTEKIQEKLHVKRSTVISSITPALYAYNSIVSGFKGNMKGAGSWAVASILIFLVVSGERVYKSFDREKPKHAFSETADAREAVFRQIRLPLILTGVTGLAAGTVLQGSFSDAFLIIGDMGSFLGICIYLLTSSNGMGKKAKDFAKSMLQKAKALASRVKEKANEKAKDVIGGFVPQPAPEPQLVPIHTHFDGASI